MTNGGVVVAGSTPMARASIPSVTIGLVLALVAAPAVGVAATAGHTVAPGGDLSQSAGVSVSDDRCGTVEHATVSDLILSVEIPNGTVANLEVEGEETDANITNGSVLFDRVRISVDRAALEEDRIRPTSKEITVVSGSFFVQNATATVDGENISLDNRRLTVDENAASDDGITITGVEQVPRPPAALLENSSTEALMLADVSGDLRFDSASREVYGVAELRMETVELSADPLQPTFRNVTISDGSVAATTVTVPAKDGDITIAELEVSTGGLTFTRTDVDGDIEDRTARFDEVALEQRQLTELLDDSCGGSVGF